MTDDPQMELPFAEFSLSALTERAILCLQTFAPLDGSPYWVGHSGGKDSCVIADLCRRAGVPHELHHAHTTIDAPETVRFVRSIPGVIIHMPTRSFWQELAYRGFPSRLLRWCCNSFKEGAAPDKSTAVFGIRAEESIRRARSWNQVQRMKRSGAQYTVINPILSWRDKDVWGYIRANNIPVCSLYEKGYKRIGCILCPMNSRRLDEAKEYPTYMEKWRREGRRWWDNHPDASARKKFAAYEDYWAWYWSGDSYPHEDDCPGMQLF